MDRHVDNMTMEIINTRLALLTASQGEEFPYTVSVSGHSFVIHKGVFSPRYFESPEIFSSIFPYRAGDTMLEMGCGAGYTSIIGALKGAKRIVAVDCSPAAIQNALINIANHRVEDVITVIKSDLFAAIDTCERFQTIYWNMPWVYAPDTWTDRTILERSVLDPGYRHTERFLQQAFQFLATGGRLLLGFGNFGNTDEFLRLARLHSYEIEIFCERPSIRNPDDVYYLYQLRHD